MIAPLLSFLSNTLYFFHCFDILFMLALQLFPLSQHRAPGSVSGIRITTQEHRAGLLRGISAEVTRKKTGNLSRQVPRSFNSTGVDTVMNGQHPINYPMQSRGRARLRSRQKSRAQPTPAAAKKPDLLEHTDPQMGLSHIQPERSSAVPRHLH